LSTNRSPSTSSNWWPLSRRSMNAEILCRVEQIDIPMRAGCTVRAAARPILRRASTARRRRRGGPGRGARSRRPTSTPVSPAGSTARITPVGGTLRPVRDGRSASRERHRSGRDSRGPRVRRSSKPRTAPPLVESSSRALTTPIHATRAPGGELPQTRCAPPFVHASERHRAERSDARGGRHAVCIQSWRC
jgi:hypothetical protein